MYLFVILILLISELGLILAHLGSFSLINLSLLTLALLGIILKTCRGLIYQTRNNGRHKCRPYGYIKREFLYNQIPAILLLPVAAVAVLLFFHPYEYMDGGWDPGGYINTGVHIGRTGSVVYHDEILSGMNRYDRKLVSARIRTDGTGIKYPGLYIKDADSGLVVPQFFHLYPVWIAIFYRLAGSEAVFYVNPFFALFSVILMFLIGRRTIGKGYGLIAGFLLAVNVIQIWNARFSTSEMLGQFLLLSGFYFWIEYLDSKDRFFAFFAGLAIGEFLLVNVTSLLIVPVAAIYLVFRANKKDIYFAIPFFLILTHLVIQLCTFSSTYFESVMAFFSRREIYLCIGAFLLALISVPLLKKVPEKYLRFSLIFIIAGAFIYAYLIRPYLVSSIEALNLVELGRYLSPLGLVLSAAGLILLTRKENRSALLFFVITGFICAVFFIYNKRMYSRYPFALRRYIPIVIPVHCFCISYFLSFLNQKLKTTGRFLSVIAISLIAAIPFYGCKHIIRVRDYHGSLNFWKEFAEQLDDDAIYFSSHYRWARPLTDMFGKEVLAWTGTPEFGGEKIACFAKKLIGSGKKVYYISHLPGPYSLSVDFVKVYKKSLETEQLEHSLTFPRRIKTVNLCLTVFRIIPVEESEVRSDEYMVDIGAGTMGLLGGFDRARRFSDVDGHARWTFSKADLIIPWFGDDTAQTLTIFASGMPDEAGNSHVSLYINNHPVVEKSPVGQNLEEHTFFIPAGTVRTGNKKRVVLTIKSNTWNPGEYGIKGYPSQLGIKVDWIKIVTSIKNQEK